MNGDGAGEGIGVIEAKGTVAVPLPAVALVAVAVVFVPPAAVPPAAVPPAAVPPVAVFVPLAVDPPAIAHVEVFVPLAVFPRHAVAALQYLQDAAARLNVLCFFSNLDERHQKILAADPLPRHD